MIATPKFDTTTLYAFYVTRITDHLILPKRICPRVIRITDHVTTKTYMFLMSSEELTICYYQNVSFMSPTSTSSLRARTASTCASKPIHVLIQSTKLREGFISALKWDLNRSPRRLSSNHSHKMDIYYLLNNFKIIVILINLLEVLLHFKHQPTWTPLQTYKAL